MFGNIRANIIRLLRWSEKYTKTDMIYLAESGFWLNGNVFISYILAFVLSILFANILAKEVFGTYQYLLSFATIIGSITMTGMNYAITQATARGFGGTLKVAIRTQLQWSVVPFVASILLAAYYTSADNIIIATGIIIIGVFVPIINTFNTYTAYLNGIKDFRGLFVSSNILNAIYYPAIILATLITPYALVLLAVNLCVNALGTWYVYSRTLAIHNPMGAVDDTSLAYGKKLSIANLPGIIAAQIDNILVFHLLGASSLAIYTIATAIPEKLTGLFKFIFFASLPKYATQNNEETIVGMRGKMLRVGGIAILIALTFAATAPILFHIVFPQYLDAIPYTQIYALVILTAVTYLPTSALIAQARSGIYIYSIISPFLQIVFQIVGILLWGLWGIIIARIISGLINAILAWIFIALGTRWSNDSTAS